MSDWLPTVDNLNYGVAIANFDSSNNEQHLHLNVGDTVHILQACRAIVQSAKAIALSPQPTVTISGGEQTGIMATTQGFDIGREFFPAHTYSSKKQICYETPVPRELPIVQEITCTLREWSLHWKELYIIIWKMMRELMNWRGTIMSQKLTQDDLKELQHKVTRTMDIGNANLGLDLVVRDVDGNILDATQACTIDLFRQTEFIYAFLWDQGLRNHKEPHFVNHQVVTQRVHADRNSLHSHAASKRSTSFSLFVWVKNFVSRVQEVSDVYITLYDAKKNEYISESYLTGWTENGMPRNMEMFTNLRVLFTDLGIKDSERERVFLVCHVIRIGRMDLKDTDTKKQTRGIRRPFGIAAIDVTDIFIGKFELDTDKEMCIPFQQCGEKDSLDGLLKKFVLAKEFNAKGQGVWITLKKIPGDIRQAQKEYAHLLSGSTAIARKMGFPDVIQPGDVRNDIYVTIANGEFKRGNKTSDKNVEVTLCVCDKIGRVLPNAIIDGAGDKPLTNYRSVIYYHEDKPKWQETVKVAIPFEDFHGAHLKFTFKHRSSTEAKDTKKPFGISFVKLMQENGTTLPDMQHELLVYRTDPKRAEEGILYLSLPSTRQELSSRTTGSNPLAKTTISAGTLTLSNHDEFIINTLVCSTKLTHDVNLMGLLKWRDNLSSLKHYLLALTTVDGEEVVKFLQDVLDALFYILMQNSKCDRYDKLVFDALIFLIGLVSNHKYSQFKPMLDVYIQDNFSATLAYTAQCPSPTSHQGVATPDVLLILCSKLLDVLKDYIEAPKDKGHIAVLLKTLKSLEYLFKFIVRSRVLFAALSGQDDKQSFECQLQQVFFSVNAMMKDTNESHLQIQEAALKFVPTTVADVITVFNRVEFSNILVEFIQSVPRDRLIKLKITCMNDIIHSQLFMYADCRAALLPSMMDQIQNLLENTSELEFCVKLVSDILQITFRDDIGNTRDDVICIVLSVLRTIIQTIINMDRHNIIIGNFVAVMTAILRQMTEYHYMCYINHFPTTIDLTDFLTEILMIFRDLVTHNVYPADWNEMIMLQNSVFLKALRHFSHTIQDKFKEPFEYPLWNNFFLCAIAFLTQEPLQLEQFSTAKRSKIISTYRDMRREMGFEIKAMWFNLVHHKSQFIPDIVGPILEMTLIPEIELRRATIPIFFDMMYCEYTMITTGQYRKGNFNRFENEMITQLDALADAGKGDEQYKDLFYTIMMEKCAKHDLMKKDGVAFVTTVHEQLEKLLEYRVIKHDESKENRMTCIVSLLEFYQEVKRQEMYIRYLHKLCDLHLDCDNYTEAAYTLLMYAKLLKWTSDPLPEMLRSKKFPDLDTHRDLLEKLYYDIINYFDKGKMWEAGIELCKVLAEQYESETFNYIQLSEILKMRAEFYDNIMKTDRPQPQYFRVGYYGMGFPKFVRNMVYIYRGKEFERLTDFTARLVNQFPNAVLMKTLNTPGDDIKQSPNQYLQINAVSPQMEPNSKFSMRHVHDQILKYYRFNEVQSFQYKKVLDTEESADVTKMWLERSLMKISDPLPGILRWFPVRESRTYKVSPLENAIETLEHTNQKLRAMIDQHQLNNNLQTKTLSMVVNGIVDAAVSGGITNYKVFYGEEYEQNTTDPLDKSSIKRLRQITTLQIFLLQTALDIHSEKVAEDLKPLHAHMEEKFQELKNYVETECHIKLNAETQAKMSATFCPIKRMKTMPTRYRHAESPPSTPKTPLSRVAHTASTFNHHGPSPHSSTPITLRDGTPRSFSKVMSSMGMSMGASNGSFTSLNNSYVNDDQNSVNSLSTSRSRTDSIVIELNEQLTPARPPRPERRSRSKSSEFKSFRLARRSDDYSSASSSQASLNSASNTASEDDPPPLPAKSSIADYSLLMDAPQVFPRERVTSRIIHAKNSVMLPEPPGESRTDVDGVNDLEYPTTPTPTRQLSLDSNMEFKVMNKTEPPL